MIKTAITLLILIVTISKGISQNFNDSITCLPNSHLKKAINRLETCKTIESELKLTQNKVTTLEFIIIKKDGILSEMKKKDSIQLQEMLSYQKVIQNNNIQISNHQSIESLQSKQLKSQKIKKWATLAIGLIAGYLIGK